MAQLSGGDVSNETESLIIFRSGAMRFGLDVNLVERVISACEISALPGAPIAVSGIVTIGGEVVPVIDPVLPFWPDRASNLNATSRFLMVRSNRRLLALIAETVDGLESYSSSSIEAADRLPTTLPQLKGMAAGLEGLIYISNPEGLLSEQDELCLSSAMVELKDAS